MRRMLGVLVVLQTFVFLVSCQPIAANKEQAKKSTKPALGSSGTAGKAVGSLSKPPTVNRITNVIGMKLVKIPAGEFKMGSGKSAAEIAKLFDSKEEFYKSEHPQHLVRISKSFYFATTEVTQGQWKAVMKTTPWKGKGLVRKGDNYAASYVSWEDAVEYCRLLSKKDVRKYRLPTEAEWEYACRAGSTKVYSFGSDASELKNYAWPRVRLNTFDVDKEYGHQVGQKRPNAWGLYDMHGNVWEWCSDWYGEDYYTKSPGVDPSGPASGSSRVSRGGAWFDDPQYFRSAYRTRFAPSLGGPDFGFRVVCASD